MDARGLGIEDAVAVEVEGPGSTLRETSLQRLRNSDRVIPPELIADLLMMSLAMTAKQV